MRSCFPAWFWMLLRSRLLEAIARGSLRAACQVCKLPTYNEWQCGPNLQSMFETLLYQSMMQKYKRAIEEEKVTAKINAEVLENRELLVKKDGNTRRYCDAFLRNERVFVVVDAIADFWGAAWDWQPSPCGLCDWCPP